MIRTFHTHTTASVSLTSNVVSPDNLLYSVDAGVKRNF